MPAFLVGGYTATMSGNAAGIGLIDTIEPSAALTFRGVVAEISSPSYLAESSGVVYAADEGNGRVAAFVRVGDALTTIGSQSTSGTSPCQLTVSDRRLYVSNYGTGSVDVFALETDGRIGPVLQSVVDSGSGPHPAQEGPHAHATLVHGETVLTANLGNDSVGVYQWRAGVLERVGALPFPPGTGPRDFALTPGGRVFVLGELSGKLHAVDLNQNVVAPGISVTTTPVAGDHGAGLALSNDARFVYTGLRGSDRIAVLDIERGEPVGVVACGGSWPRHLTIADGRLYVACERSDSVTVFDLDERSGSPRFAYSVAVPSPTFLLELLAS